MSDGKLLKIACISILLFLTIGLSAEDWPRWRGAEGDSVYRDNDWNYNKLSEKSLWETNIGEGYSAPSISSGKLVTLGFTGGKDVISSYDALTGSKLWSHSYSSVRGEYPGPRSTPVIDNGKVYTMSRIGVLLCLDLNNGREIWKKDLQRELGINLPGWHLAGSPVIDGNVLYLNVNRHGAALDKNSGEVLWSSPSGTGGYASPVLYEQNGKNYLAVFGRNKIYSVNRDDGSVAWSHDWSTSYDVSAADPLVIDEKLFISTAYNKGALMLDISGRNVRELWTNRKIASHFSSFVVHEGYLYGSSGTAGRSFSAATMCVDPDDGSLLWSERNGFGSLILGGDKLIFLTESGKLMIIEADRGSYNELKSIQVPRGQYWTAPVLANGLLYVRSSGGDLTCYDLRK